MDSSKSTQALKKSQTMLSGTDGHQFDNDEFTSEGALDKMVVSKSETSDKGQDEFGENHSPSLQQSTPSNTPNRGSPCIGAFTIQCAKCFKWRLVPTKEKYEEIREHIIQEPFECERAREWKPDVTCDDPEDISQDGSRLWAIDKPNIARAPNGWERQIRIRGEGGTKFADVYYTSPSGRKLRSQVEVDKYLKENPEYGEKGVKSTQFSFQIPRPLRENYVKHVKKRPKLASPSDEANIITSKPLQPVEANPISWAAPPTHEGQASEQVSHAADPFGSVEAELTRKRKAESSPGEVNASDELKPKIEDAQNGDTSTA
ncbi:methyl-CpG-binding domain-containing protein 2 isoform X2 [Brachypodium distachyon]|uniref:MBD domain-containing protein n=1 Tax=Brachypodium distachyon TaxID=15368 RepID=I1IRD7_BRADI|nr:methyl-CpG-binding domain-containing protein 2 isoform X2 [Brachypodium distachyon]KQJ90818.1 hypothetical protein BRADI_4g34050v3 [Brachypodium distachyon]PNT64856.1 hypothetical protein BRADI_4g34050v3 [Brachypodium distachyon]|eukprot:XP_003578356.1 methyl-CpG-binding domain-containing protein 2 isoform X2 [Brachypodium distachyon]